MPNASAIVAISARRVEAQRVRQNLTVRALARRMKNRNSGKRGTSESALSRTLARIEAGYLVQPDTALRLAEALKVPLDDILRRGAE